MVASGRSSAVRRGVCFVTCQHKRDSGETFFRSMPSAMDVDALPVNRTLDLTVDDDDAEEEEVTIVAVKPAPASTSVSNAASTPVATNLSAKRPCASDVHPKATRAHPSKRRAHSGSAVPVRRTASADSGGAVPAVLPRKKAIRLPPGWTAAMEARYPLPVCACPHGPFACLKRASLSAKDHPNEFYYRCYDKDSGCGFWELAKNIHGDKWPHDATDYFTPTKWL